MVFFQGLAANIYQTSLQANVNLFCDSPAAFSAPQTMVKRPTRRCFAGPSLHLLTISRCWIIPKPISDRVRYPPCWPVALHGVFADPCPLLHNCLTKTSPPRRPLLPSRCCCRIAKVCPRTAAPLRQEFSCSAVSSIRYGKVCCLHRQQPQCAFLRSNMLRSALMSGWGCLDMAWGVVWSRPAICRIKAEIAQSPVRFALLRGLAVLTVLTTAQDSENARGETND